MVKSDATALILLTSPHKGGITDRLGAAFAAGAARKGLHTEEVSLRDWAIRPCTGCLTCMDENSRCPLNEQDDVAWLLDKIAAAHTLAIACPVYFYSVPALFKALIDRSQPWWQTFKTKPQKSWYALLAAGRSRGENLFEGCLRTLKLFLHPQGFELAGSLLVRGTDAKGLTSDELAMACQFGFDAPYREG